MVKPAVLYTTTTTIGTAEIATVLDKGQRLLADLAITMGYQRSLGENVTCDCLLKELYLYLYAIQSWDVSPGAINFFSQMGLIGLLSKVEQMFYICNFKPAC